ncbi:hypothetical protein BCR33DRAFT_197909 [Rhizoclosmatium globosum]|uniref:Uncharacterized protein n=1 Tax=Rhizoclosmatium globosum TaxID=329046 RepID=A0A1Y2CE12_9FUNG|nr:hypothetical protein BCR33DRAFT_197909 [Rhizoclosmatium globosum]|eukprot:ORY45279.1 hypothetical protein BCR33DRAFT_197909 [Rhizoclosmatium globosum]
MERRAKPSPRSAEAKSLLNRFRVAGSFEGRVGGGERRCLGLWSLLFGCRSCGRGALVGLVVVALWLRRIVGGVVECIRLLMGIIGIGVQCYGRQKKIVLVG